VLPALNDKERLLGNCIPTRRDNHLTSINLVDILQVCKMYQEKAEARGQPRKLHCCPRQPKLLSAQAFVVRLSTYLCHSQLWRPPMPKQLAKATVRQVDDLLMRPSSWKDSAISQTTFFDEQPHTPKAPNPARLFSHSAMKHATPGTARST